MSFRTALAIMIAGAVFLFSSGCEKKTPPKEWNILWIVMDDVKASHLGVMGYERAPTTPNIDRFAKSAVLFKNTVTQSPWSLPSYASMLTSRYPHDLVLTKNYVVHVRAETDVAKSRDPNRMPDMNKHWFGPLDEDVETIATILRKEGFKTAGFVNNAWLKPDAYGLERGFGHYFDGLAGKTPYTYADQTSDLALEWIRQNKDERFFLFIQFMDPHKPWQSHPDMDFGTGQADRYDAEIAFTDRAVGKILAALDEMDLTRETVVIVNSDHGEGVFPDGRTFVGHGGGVIPEIVFVPLLIGWPGGPAGDQVETMCANIDIMPTALDLLGLPVPVDLKGVSLKDAAEQSGKIAKRAFFTSAVLKGPEQVSVIRQGTEPGLFYQGVVVPAYSRVNTYTVRDGEITEGTPEAVTAFLVQDLKTYVKESLDTIEAKGRGRVPPDLDEKTIKSLKSLGYMGGN